MCHFTPTLHVSEMHDLLVLLSLSKPQSMQPSSHYNTVVHQTHVKKASSTTTSCLLTSWFSPAVVESTSLL